MVKDRDNQQGLEDEKNENKSTGNKLLDAATQATEDDCLILLKALAVGQIEQNHDDLGFSMMIFIEAMESNKRNLFMGLLSAFAIEEIPQIKQYADLFAAFNEQGNKTIH
jgi:hypothetical protein